MRIHSKFLTQPWYISATGLAAFMDTHSVDIQSADLSIDDFLTPRKPMQITEDAVAVIAVSGTLLNGAPAIYSKVFGDTNYEDLQAELQEAAGDKRVAGIFLDVNSPGGSAVGCSELFNLVSSIDKPVVAFCGEMCCSAAYYIASGADFIYATPSAIVGCIGSVMTVYDITEYLDKLGVTALQFASGWFKGAGTDGVPLSDDQKAFMQDFVNQSGAKFKGDMTAARGIADESMEGQHYWAENAPTGMVDHLSGRDKVYSDLLAMIG